MSEAPPFSCTYSPSVPLLLSQLKITLLLSTYQAGKVVLLSAKDENSLVQLPRQFPKPMGIAVDGNHLAIATKHQIISFYNDSTLAKTYTLQPNVYDAMYVPRVIYNTGLLDIHDLHFENENMIAVNTVFSCLMRTSHQYSFEPIWKPSFISELVPEDRCHLNGLAVRDNDFFVTCFSNSNTAKGWKENILSSGLLIHAQSNQIISSKLSMPHSPRFHNGKMYLLLSATGELIEMNLSDGKYNVVCKINDFVRGLAFYSDFAFIGLSKLRKSSSTFAKLQTETFDDKSGIVIVHLPTGKIYGEIIYQSSVEEIFDIQVLPGKMRPNILNTEKPEHAFAVSLPGNSWWAKPDVES